MPSKFEQISPTKVKFTISCDDKILASAKEIAVAKLAKDVKVPGFRAGKAPANVIEKHLDQNLLQSEFINEAVLGAYEQAVIESKVRVIGQPQISILKLVPFSELEFSAETEAVGEIKLGKYKGLAIKKVDSVVSESDVAGVIENLLARSAEKEEVKRPVKDGDEVNIDFKGVDAATKEAIAGADAKSYDLIIGSKSFIPGFEAKLIGLKPKETTDFDLTFPKGYGVDSLKSKKVSFTVTVNAIKELRKPKLDDKLVATFGPFRTVAEFKKSIKEQLKNEKNKEALSKLDNDLLAKITETSHVDIPEILIAEEINRIEEEEKRNLVYRGQTWQEHLGSEGVTQEEHRERQRAPAEIRVKSGLILGAIADKENISVSQVELEARLNLLKKTYQDEAMQAELAKPENIRDIRSRMMVEKTLEKIRSLN